MSARSSSGSVVTRYVDPIDTVLYNIQTEDDALLDEWLGLGFGRRDDRSTTASYWCNLKEIYREYGLDLYRDGLPAGTKAAYSRRAYQKTRQTK